MRKAVRGYRPPLQTRFDDWPRRLRDLEALAEMTKRYRSLGSMLSRFLTAVPGSLYTRQSTGKNYNG